MYNRYIPQPDGTYRKNQIPDKASSPPTPPPEDRRHREPPRDPNPGPEPPPTPCAACSHSPNRRFPPPRSQRNAQPVSVGNFLKQLLPRDFNTEDLMIVLLLLLMAGDCQEEQNTALLTLMLYLFL